MKHARVGFSQNAQERLVSSLTIDLLESVAGGSSLQGWSILSSVDVGGSSPSDLVVTINTTPLNGVLLGCVQVRMIESQSTDRFRFVASTSKPSILQHQELRYSSPKESVGVFFTYRVLSTTKLKECGYSHLIKPLHTHSKLRVLVVWVLTYHSVATKSSVPETKVYRSAVLRVKRVVI